jgi:hypothetical protein
MKKWTKYMERWNLSGMLMLLLVLTACSSESGDGAQQPKEKPVLKIYLFAPESPIITRAENGWVSPSADEKRISTLDVWVFENNTSTLVSYIHLANLTFDGSKEVSMEISDAFANNINKPHVDIYVIANVASSNCGLSLGRSSTPEQLTAALIEHKSGGGDFFGLTSPVTSVPVEGLPMSGFLLNQEITGTAPVFSANKTKNVKLVRAVSKVRFVFSKSTVAPVISDLSIKLNNGVLPTKEYLFLKGEYPTEKIHLEETPAYESEAEIVSGVSGDDINSCADPASYIFTTESGQQYENKIDAGLVEQTIENVTRPAELSEVRRFYLRESDKQMMGTISYTSGSGENATQKSADFVMNAAGDFTRNHTWIVYGYFLGSGELILNAVALKDWEDNPESDNIYNW